MESLKEKRELLKQYLNRYTIAKQRVIELDNLHDKLREDFNFPIKGGYKEYPAVRSSSVSQGAASFSFRLAEIEDRIAEQKSKMVKILEQIFAIIDFLDTESEYRNILERKYIEGQTHAQIYKDKHMCKSNYYDKFYKSLDTLLTFAKVNAILDNFQQEIQKL